MSGEIRSYRDLEVWRRGVALVKSVHEVTSQFPSSERFVLASQMQRAAISIPANVAEGHGRHYRREYANFLSNAHGSLMELETHFVIAESLGYLTPQSTKELRARTESIGRMLNALIRSLSRPLAPIPDPHPQHVTSKGSDSTHGSFRRIAPGGLGLPRSGAGIKGSPLTSLGVPKS